MLKRLSIMHVVDTQSNLDEFSSSISSERAKALRSQMFHVLKF